MSTSEHTSVCMAAIHRGICGRAPQTPHACYRQTQHCAWLGAGQGTLGRGAHLRVAAQPAPAQDPLRARSWAAHSVHAAVDEVFGPVPVQRCVRHKERNVLDHLPERDCPVVKTRLRRAWASDNYALALEGLRTLAGELQHSHPGAAASLAEGLEETLTLIRLGIHGRLKKTLASTNPIESMIEIIRRTPRNVKRWQSGDMCLRWTAAGCSRPRLNSGRSSATPTSQSSPSPLNATSQRSAPPLTPQPTRRPSHPPACNHHTQPPPRTSTANGTTSG